MQYQLRTYTMKPGLMDEFIENWRRYFVPTREAHGFTIVGSWINHEAYEFIWLVSYAGPEGYTAAEDVYLASAERAAIPWDPKPYIEKMELRILDPVKSH